MHVERTTYLNPKNTDAVEIDSGHDNNEVEISTCISVLWSNIVLPRPLLNLFLKRTNADSANSTSHEH